MSGERATYIIDLRDAFSPKLKDASKNLDGFESKIKKTGDSMNGLGAIGSRLAGVLTLGAVAAGIKKLSDLGAEAESTRTLFRTMLGDIKAGDELLSQLKGYANVTPYVGKDIINSGKTLLSFGIEAERVLPIVKTLGDIAAGNNERFQALSLSFAQMSSAGRLMGQDLLQMINAGFNPLQVISQKTGISIGDLKKKMEDGEITATMVGKAFKMATQEGGLFFDMANKQSQTFGGKMSTLIDKLDVGLTNIGERLNRSLMPVLDKILEVLDHGDVNAKGQSYQSAKKDEAQLKTLYNAYKEAKGTAFEKEYENMILDKFPELGTDWSTGKSTGLSDQKVETKLGALLNSKNKNYVLDSEYNELISSKYNKINELQNQINANDDGNTGALGRLFGSQKLSDQDVRNRMEDIGKLHDEIKRLNEDRKLFMPVSSDDAKAKMMSVWQNGTGGFGDLTGDGKKKKDKKDKVDGEVRSGGVKNITINIHKLVDQITFETLNNQSESQVIEIVKRALMTAVNDANIAVN